MVPKLRFKEFINPWSEFLLGNLSNLSRGKFSVRPRNDPKYFGGNMPFIQTGDIVKSELYVEQYTQTLNELGVTVSKVFPSGTIMITIAANIGDLAILKYPMACPDSLVGIEAKKNISNNLWLMYALSLKKDELDANATQNAQKNINLQVLNALTISAPLLSEQTKIADFLSSVDEKIILLSKQYDRLCYYKKGLMQKIFSQELRFKDDNEEEFTEWYFFRAVELFKNSSNKNHNGDLPILAVTQENGVVSRDSINIDIKSSQESINSYKIIDKGDFVISLRSFQGGIEYSPLHGICSPAYTVLKNIKPIVDGFYRCYLKKDSFIEELSQTVVGIRDGKQISYQAFSTLELPYPSVPEQKKISDFFSALDDKIAAKKTELDKLKTWKQGLLQQMFV